MEWFHDLSAYYNRGHQVIAYNWSILRSVLSEELLTESANDCWSCYMLSFKLIGNLWLDNKTFEIHCPMIFKILPGYWSAPLMYFKHSLLNINAEWGYWAFIAQIKSYHFYCCIIFIDSITFAHSSASNMYWSSCLVTVKLQ